MEWHANVTDISRRVVSELAQLPTRSLGPDSYVFSDDGRKPWQAHAINQKWHKVLALAGVRYRNPEQCRHTWASQMLSRNAKLPYIQSQGGWSSAIVLLRTYTKWKPTTQDTAAADFEYSDAELNASLSASLVESTDTAQLERMLA